MDILEQKMTLPLLGALSVASEEKSREIRNMVRDIPAHPEYRDAIVTFVKENDGISYAVRRLEEYVDKAVDALSLLRDSEEKRLLVKLAHYTAVREK